MSYRKLLIKKKIKTRFNYIEVLKSHPLAVCSGGFGISPYLQELQCHVGQNDIYESGSKMLSKLLRLPMDKKQIERVSKYHSEKVSHHLSDEVAKQLPQLMDKDEKLYVMMDGSMLLTRNEGSQASSDKEEVESTDTESQEASSNWKEVKLARLFSTKSIYSLNKERNWIKESLYVGHLGKHTDFLEKLSAYTDQYDQEMVFINDGAHWIWNWVESYYPSSVQILDFYHAKEYLAEFAKSQFSDKKEKKEWIEKQENQLWQDQIAQVLTDIEALQTKTKKQQKAKNKILTYYNNHQERMKYGTFKKKGYLVGSGPIESANRTVVQKRMKLSGQRWTKDGAQKILDLRIINLNDNWDKVIDSVNGKLVA